MEKDFFILLKEQSFSAVFNKAKIQVNKKLGAFRGCLLFSIFVVCVAKTSILNGSENIKGKIADETALLKTSLNPQEKSAAYYRLAVALCKDQEADRAFIQFLEALKCTPHKESPAMSEEEKAVYEESFHYYLMHSSTDPSKTSHELIEKYSIAASQHPEYLHLNFLLSAAYANLGNFLLFFEHFYRCYPFLWDTYLSYKTQGILYLRLYQHEKSQEERKHFHAAAMNFLTLALEKNFKDPGLYKILIALAKESKNDGLILEYLQKMVKAEVVIPRSDVFLYVHEAVILEEFELGQEMIDQARRVYEVSRSITAAQDFLDQYKNG